MTYVLNVSLPRPPESGRSALGIMHVILGIELDQGPDYEGRMSPSARMYRSSKFLPTAVEAISGALIVMRNNPMTGTWRISRFYLLSVKSPRISAMAFEKPSSPSIWTCQGLEQLEWPHECISMGRRVFVVRLGRGCGVDKLQHGFKRWTETELTGSPCQFGIVGLAVGTSSHQKR